MPRILKDIVNDSKKSRRKIGRKSMLLLSDSEEDDYDTACLQTMKANNNNNNNNYKDEKFRRNQSLCLDDDDDDDDDESDGYLSPLDQDKENANPNTEQGKMSKRKQHPDSGKKTVAEAKDVKLHKKTPNPKPKKLRRRSSARFLRLSGRFNDEDDQGMEDETPVEEQREKLNEMYSKAIQLNAANKINAVNSWGLNIIDKMDKFLGDDEDDNVTSSPNDVVENRSLEEVGDSVKEKRVNFTKASCTIDACVKIYSYRVDDAHLTSYKVLANLNRTDGGKGAENPNLEMDDEPLDHEDRNSVQRHANQKRIDRNVEVKTVETNIANLNISKLDSAYDIDPIFHKMSKKFDEGGAKGLLLVNLGVANDGCRIVLDSKEDSGADESVEPELVDETDEEANSQKEGMLDITTLAKILEKKLNDTAIDSIQLVPQLSELRQMYTVLEEEGYVEASKKFKSRRYANNAEEDKAAEDAIHREALERSTASGIQHKTSFLLPNNSAIATNLSLMGTFYSASQENSNNYNDDNYADGHDDWDDGDDGDFETFVAMDDHAEKYSSESFRYDLTQDDIDVKNLAVAPTDSSSKAYGTTFLDEICEGDILTDRNQFNYFDPKLIEKFTSGNKWAGAAHWKKSQSSMRLKKPENQEQVVENKKRKDSKRKKTKDVKEKCLVDFSLSSTHSCLDDLLKKTKKVRGRAVKSETQITKAAKQKYDKENNLLPIDADITVKHFTEFFMRPGATLMPVTGNSITAPKKSVGFLNIDTENFEDGVDDSYDDGPGFELAGDTTNNDDDIDNFAVCELEGVRKVEKIVVKHATVAKKVDVKRLKHDLWTELEEKTSPEQYPLPEQDKTSDNDDIDKHKESEIKKVVSFKETVQKLSATEAQEEVSLPFYFICILHLANEKGLKLENRDHGLSDFVISMDTGAPSN